MAARNANVSVNGFGFFLLVLYPGAFVEIDSNELGKKLNFGITALCINVLNSIQKGPRMLKRYEYSPRVFGIICNIH